jgi:phenylalanyl-tRNA synthetase alpha subunit
VFRNEAVDRTHLAEFHQVEGLVCDRGLTLGHLIATLQVNTATMLLRALGVIITGGYCHRINTEWRVAVRFQSQRRWTGSWHRLFAARSVDV